jgi:PKD repeat protein
VCARRVHGSLVLLGLLAAAVGCSLVETPPVARFDVDPPVPYAGESIRFDATPSTGASSIVDFTWDLGNSQIASGREVTTTYALPGSYTVSLTVEDASGRTSTATGEVTVYVRGGTRIFQDDFSGGEAALGRWPLDPTWATANESMIDHLAEPHGDCLYVHSGTDRWHRRYARVTLPPLRLGQKVVFVCEAMTLHNQDAHTFLIVPARRELGSSAGSLPFFEFTSDGGGSYVREPTAYDAGVAHPIPFTPSIYQWHTYRFVYAADAYELWVDDILRLEGPVSVDLTEGGDWFILLGEESSTEACSAYYDDVRVSVEE